MENIGTKTLDSPVGIESPKVPQTSKSGVMETRSATAMFEMKLRRNLSEGCRLAAAFDVLLSSLVPTVEDTQVPCEAHEDPQLSCERLSKAQLLYSTLGRMIQRIRSMPKTLWRLKQKFARCSKKCFGHLGDWVYDRPWLVIIVSTLMVVALSAGWFVKQNEKSLEKLYSLPGSRTEKEYSTLGATLGDIGRTSFVLVTTVDGAEEFIGGGIITAGVLQRMAVLDELITHGITVKSNEQNDVKDWDYNRLCEHWPPRGDEEQGDCMKMSVLEFYRGESLLGRPLAVTNWPAVVNHHTHRTYPGDYLIAEPQIVTRGMNDMPLLTNATGFLMAYKFSSGFGNLTRLWEEEFVTTMQKFDFGVPGVKVNFFAEGSWETEILRAAEISSADFLCLGIAVVLILSYCISMNCSWALYKSKPISAICGTLAALYGFITGGGLVYLCGITHTEAMNISPFLILGIGLDDMFVIMNAYTLTYLRGDARGRIRATMEDAGVAITVTTLTNLISFGIGTMSQYLAVRNFCWSVFAGLIGSYVYALTFFLAVLCLEAKQEEMKRELMTEWFWFGGKRGHVTEINCGQEKEVEGVHDEDSEATRGMDELRTTSFVDIEDQDVVYQCSHLTESDGHEAVKIRGCKLNVEKISVELIEVEERLITEGTMPIDLARGMNTYQLVGRHVQIADLKRQRALGLGEGGRVYCCWLGGCAGGRGEESTIVDISSNVTTAASGTEQQTSTYRIGEFDANDLNGSKLTKGCHDMRRSQSYTFGEAKLSEQTDELTAQTEGQNGRFELSSKHISDEQDENINTRHKISVEEPKGNVGKWIRSMYLRCFVSILAYWPLKVLILAAFAVHLCVALYGMTIVRAGMHLEDLFPIDSHLRDAFATARRRFSSFGQASVVLFADPVPWWQPAVFRAYEEFSCVLEEQWYHRSAFNGMQAFLKASNATEFTGNKTHFMTKLRAWLNEDAGTYYRGDFRFNEEGDLQDYKFTLMTPLFEDALDALRYMEDVRRLTDSWEKFFQPIVYTLSFRFSETDSVIKQQTLTGALSAFIAVFLVSALMLRGFRSALLVCVVMAMVDIGVLGFMPFVGLELNMLTMITLIMSIGFSVDYTLHIVHAFTECTGPDRRSRAKETIVLMGVAVTHGCTSTFVGIMPLCWRQEYMHALFFKMVILILVTGFCYGVFFLPVLMSLMGPMHQPYHAIVESPTKADSNQNEKHCSNMPAISIMC